MYTLIHTEATTEATEPRITSRHATPIKAVTCFVSVHTDASFGAVRTPGTSRTFLIRRMKMCVFFILNIATRTMWSCAIFLLNTVWRLYLITQNIPEAQKLRVTVYDETMWTPHLNHGRNKHYNDALLGAIASQIKSLTIEIMYLFQTSTFAVEVWGWLSNFISHFNGYVITYQRCDES